MADVKQCDICGAIFPKYTDVWNSEFHVSRRLKNPENINLRWEFKDTDCCPDCTQKVEGFIEALSFPNKKMSFI